MNNLADLSGRPRKFTAGSETYDVYPLTIDDLGALQDWVDQQFGDPNAVARDLMSSGLYTVEQQKFLIRAALELSSRGRHLIGTPEADEKVSSFAGIKQILYLSIRKGRPSFTEADADRAFQQATPLDLALVFQTSGVGLITDPKAATPTTPDGTTTSGQADQVPPTGG